MRLFFSCDRSAVMSRYGAEPTRRKLSSNAARLRGDILG